MHIDILTLFPNMFSGPFTESIVKRAVDRNLVNIVIHNLRDWGIGKHKVVDDYPFGGGPGMLLKPEPLVEAIEAIEAKNDRSPASVILLTPQGRVFNQAIATELAALDRLLLICGHYEGVDERVREHMINDEISIGDFVLTGGELPAMVIIDAVVRLLPGVLGSEASLQEDSHTSGLIQYPQYTRPQSYRGWEVPEVLLSGNHAQIARWRREQSIARTLSRRPELLDSTNSSLEETKSISHT
ncbi:MAG: tRNA (guanosine(37)-N1)-methyltransferase TrmD [Chloroflexota bacterium]|nr:tRNA (guanosine(37)-N1)-methyltransferase TrmD [Chloroflexota bacterium]